MEKLSSQQKDFIRTAISVMDAVIDFSMDEKDFKEIYGYSSKKMLQEIENLSKKLNCF